MTASFDILIKPDLNCICLSNRETLVTNKTDVLQGTLDLMILQVLLSMGPLHGYAIAARLEQVSEGALQLNMGSLYPGLLRLEQRGLIRAKWETTEKNRRARFYRLTPAGRKQLDVERAGWEKMAGILRKLLGEGA